MGEKLDFNFWIHRGKYSSHKLRGKGRVPKRAYFCVLSPLPPINSAQVYMFRKRIYISFRSVRTSYGALDVRSSTHPATFFPSPFFYSSAKNIFSFSKCVLPFPSPPQKKYVPSPNIFLLLLLCFSSPKIKIFSPFLLICFSSPPQNVFSTSILEDIRYIAV